MAKLYNLARMSTATTGTGTLTLGSPISGFLSFAAAGVADGETITYAVSDGANSEISKGVYTASGTTLTRVAAGMKSTNGNTAISLSGTAQVFITPRAEDIPKGDGRIYGLTLSNNAGDATNSIDIATGFAADGVDGISMQLLSVLSKKLSVNWAVGGTTGTPAGGLDTGSIANTTYHMFLIQRSDTGVVDALFSTSPSAPTMPANYDRKRRIGSIMRASAAIRLFRQKGDVFRHAATIVDRSSVTAVTDTLLTMTLPTGVNVIHQGFLDGALTSAGALVQLLSDGDEVNANNSCLRLALAGQEGANPVSQFVTNTAAQLRFSLVASGTLSFARVWTSGWIDGRDA